MTAASTGVLTQGLATHPSPLSLGNTHPALFGWEEKAINTSLPASARGGGTRRGERRAGRGRGSSRAWAVPCPLEPPWQQGLTPPSTRANGGLRPIPERPPRLGAKTVDGVSTGGMAWCLSLWHVGTLGELGGGAGSEAKGIWPARPPHPPHCNPEWPAGPQQPSTAHHSMKRARHTHRDPTTPSARNHLVVGPGPLGLSPFPAPASEGLCSTTHGTGTGEDRTQQSLPRLADRARWHRPRVQGKSVSGAPRTSHGGKGGCLP